jgi:hypothetical protein
MPGWITTVLIGVASFFGWREKVAEKDLRDMDREAGEQGQQLADHKETLKAKDDQLQKAVNRKPGDARKRLRDSSF